MSVCTACANVCIITENRKDELIIRCPTIEKELLVPLFLLLNTCN